MKKFSLLILGSIFIFSSSAVLAEKAPRPIKDLLQSGRMRDKALIQGKVTKQIDLDYYIVEDETGDIVVGVRDVRHKLKLGDTLLAFGRYQGRTAFRSRKGQLDVTEFAMGEDAAASAALVERYGTEPKAPEPVAQPPAPPAPARSVESRLQELENLKSKNLISADEYQQQRQRILNDL